MLVSVPYRAINNFKKTYFTNFEITIENLLRMICRNLQQNAIRNISTPLNTIYSHFTLNN